MQFTLVQFTLFLFLYLQTAAADISGNIAMWDKDYAILERELIMVLLCLLARCFFFFQVQASTMLLFLDLFLVVILRPLQFYKH